MFKFLLDLFGVKAAKSLWSALHHKSAFPVWWMMATTCGMFLVFSLFFVDIPTRDKSIFEEYLHAELEGWRLDANSTRLHRLVPEMIGLAVDCKKLESQIVDMEILTLKIKTMTGASAEDIARSERLLADLKKKLVAANIAKYQNLQLYEKTYAVR